MKRKSDWVRVVSLLVFLMTPAGLSAQGIFTVFSENDSRFNKPNGATDRHYTNGSKLVYTFEPKWQWLKDFGDWGRPQSEPPALTGVGFFLGQNMYTPDHVDQPELRSDKERVFAGWLYTGMFVQRRIQDVLDHIELNIGVVGPSAHAGNAQSGIHNLLGSSKPVGWEDQIGDEPAANIVYVRKQRHLKQKTREPSHFDVISDIGAVAGSLFVRAEAGITLRYGAIPLPNDFGPGRLAVPHSPAAIDAVATRAIYVYGRAAGRAVAYDRFLTGLTPSPLVGSGELGIVCRYNNLEVGYSQTFLTHEFKEQVPYDSFGAITLTWLF